MKNSFSLRGGIFGFLRALAVLIIIGGIFFGVVGIAVGNFPAGFIFLIVGVLAGFSLYGAVS